MRAAPLVEHEPTRALALLRDQDACPTELRDFAWGYYHHLANRDRGTLTGHVGAIGAIAMSPDGRTLASAGPDGKGGTQVMLWDMATAKARGASFSCDGKDVAALAFSPDGEVAGRRRQRQAVRLTTLARDNMALLFQDDPGRRHLCPNRLPSSRRWPLPRTGDLVTAAGQGGKVWEVASGKEHASWDGPPIQEPQFCSLHCRHLWPVLAPTADAWPPPSPSYSVPKGAAPEKYPVRVFDVTAGQLLLK